MQIIRQKKLNEFLNFKINNYIKIRNFSYSKLRMKYAVFFFIMIGLFCIQCEPPKPKALLEIEAEMARKTANQEFNSTSEISSEIHKAWLQRSHNFKSTDSLIRKKSYLSVYTEIYARNENRTYPLTATISIRNMSSQDSVFIEKAEYFNTNGDLIHTYLNKSIYVNPLETLEIIISETQEYGGSGGKFIFNWSTKNEKVYPVFDAIMISSSGQQGFSFMTHGVDLEE